MPNYTRVDNSLRKIGRKPKLVPMNNSRLSREARPRPLGLSGFPWREEREKNYSAKIPRNPLKSLDSDEGIQGNPRKSSAFGRGFSRRNGDRPRKPKRIDRTTIATSRGESQTGLKPKYKSI